MTNDIVLAPWFKIFIQYQLSISIVEVQDDIIFITIGAYVNYWFLSFVLHLLSK
jgi:hypothetical protein